MVVHDPYGNIMCSVLFEDFLFSDEGFGGFSEPFSKGYPYCETPGSQQVCLYFGGTLSLREIMVPFVSRYLDVFEPLFLFLSGS